MPDRRALAAPLALVLLQLAVAGGVAAAAGTYDRAGALQLTVNVGLLAPATLVAVWWLGRQLGGELLAAAAGLALVLLPPAAIAYGQPKFHDTYRDRVLTEAVGLAGGGPLAAACGLAAASALLVCAVRGRTSLAAAAGLAAGLGALAEAPAVLFLAGAALACLVARNPRAAALVAAGAAVPVAVLLVTNDGVHVDASWHAFSLNMANLREYLWSNRLVQWLPLAGAVAVWRRSAAAGALLAGWFAAWVVVVGASPHLPVGTGAYLVAWLPTLPAAALSLAALPFLVPTLSARLDERLAAGRT